MVRVTSAQVAGTEDSVVRALEADVISVALPVAEASTVEVAEGVTWITDPLEIDWYGAGGGPGGGGGAAPLGPGGGGASPSGPAGGGGGD